MTTIRLTTAQALTRWLAVQMTEDGSRFIEGVWAIFGHGNVAGLGEALHATRAALPVWRGQNEQTMAHAAIAFAKAHRRRRAMAVTTSIGPGATNLVTAAALAHVNRLPLLMLCGDVFAGRGPDPVLQQIEDFNDATISANDCFRPVVRYFDRIQRPEQLLAALPRAFAVMTDPANCGPVCLALCQDTQAEAYDWPESFFAPRVWRLRRPAPDPDELDRAVALLRQAKRPVLLVGGGVLYSGAEAALLAFAKRHTIPLVETQAGKGAVAWEEPLNFGSAGVTGSACGNQLLQEADLILAIGTRLQDFTTGSWKLFSGQILAVNVQLMDCIKNGSQCLVSDAKIAINFLSEALGEHRYSAPDFSLRSQWFSDIDRLMAPPAGQALPSDAQVIGAVQRHASPSTVVIGAAGSMPGVLHTLWRAAAAGYHMEYGYSCMGYEIAGALGLAMARPEAEVICCVGDGSYMMANSELATAAMMGIGFTVVLTDNRGYGCINRLQAATGGAAFTNLYADCEGIHSPQIDFAAHARAMGARAEKVADVHALAAALAAARGAKTPVVIVIDSDAGPGTGAGGAWWDVAVPEVSERPAVHAARQVYDEAVLARKALR